MVRGSHSQSNKIKTFKLAKLNFAVPVMALAGIMVIGAGFINHNPDDFASATDTDIFLTSNEVTESLSVYSTATQGDGVTFTADTNADGILTAFKDTVTVENTSNGGYTLTVSATSDPTLHGTNNSNNTITSTGGTYASPSVLNTNTYGFAVPSDNSYVTSDNAFNTDNYYSATLDSVKGTYSPRTDSLWAPLATTAQTIQQTSSSGTNTVDVYYGAKLNNALPVDTYTGSITYSATATSSNTTYPSAEASIYPNTGYTGESRSVRIVTTLYTSATIPASSVTVTIGGSKCTGISTNTSTGRLEITCTAPAFTTVGSKNVVITVSSYSRTYKVNNGYVVKEQPYVIHYNANGGTGLMADQTTIDGTDAGFTTDIDNTNYTKVTLRTQNFSRANYGFAGWNTKADGTGTTYGPMETVDISSLTNSNKEVTLYAKWIASAGNIQDFTTTTCNNMSTGAVTARKDTRDSNTYTIAKLTDGKCWMIENLRLGGVSDISITTSNSVTAGTVYASTDSFSYFNTIMQQNDNNTAATSTASDGTGATYGYGNYYNWAQAIMSTTVYNDKYTKVSSSLCPKNWHLPSSKTADSDTISNNEFYALNYYANGGYNVTNSNASVALRKYPYNFVYSGWWSSTLGDGYRGTSGAYWASTVYDKDYAYTLSLGYYRGDSGGHNSKRLGQAVRCVIDN